MKIRNPFVIKLLGFVLSFVIRILDRQPAPALPVGWGKPRSLGSSNKKRHFLYVVWHETCWLRALLCPSPGRRPDQPACGRRIDCEVSGTLRHEVCAAPQRAGAQAALRQLIAGGNRATWPSRRDGPRGPASLLQGASFPVRTGRLAHRAVGCAFWRPWRFQ